MARWMWLLIPLLGCCQPSHEDGAPDSVQDGIFETAGDTTADVLPPACRDWDPYADVNPAVAEPCDPGAALSRDCEAGGNPGVQRCIYIVTGEDTGVHRWGLCQEECSADQAGTTRACEVKGVTGLQYCTDSLSLSAPHWQQCLLAACVVCTPGDTKLCGPGTNYPDTLMKCLFSDGAPYWFDGDCWT